jgi:hypothetical protein
LRDLYLNDNKFSGTLPANWRFNNINVAWNNLTGPLPSSWSAISDLELSGNNLSGSIPPGWGNATLKSVSLNDNPRLLGCLPRAWRSRAAFTLYNTRPSTAAMSFHRRAQVRDASGEVLGGITRSLSSSIGGIGYEAATVSEALKGTDVSGYC